MLTNSIHWAAQRRFGTIMGLVVGSAWYVSHFFL